ncbi:MAG: flavodoxin family protein [Firmicutes bacterium]|nr:flavodoxin family protein [Bacillota bacterium]
MRVIAFNGSPRNNGNTAIMIEHVLAILSKYNIETEMIQVGGQVLRGCAACGWCGRNPVKQCVINDDPINEWIPKIDAADGIIIGSPTYFANMTAETKALIDRVGYLSRRNSNFLQRKIGATVVSFRRAGAINVFNSINDFFLINQMILPGSNYWTLGMGREPGDVASDTEGLKTLETLAENMAWLLRLIVGANNDPLN